MVKPKRPSTYIVSHGEHIHGLSQPKASYSHNDLAANRGCELESRQRRHLQVSLICDHTFCRIWKKKLGHLLQVTMCIAEEISIEVGAGEQRIS